MTERDLIDWALNGWTEEDWASIQFLTVELADVSAEISKGFRLGTIYTPNDLCVLAKLATTISNRLADICCGYV